MKQNYFILWLIIITLSLNSSGRTVSAQDNSMISPEAQAVIKSLPQELQNLDVQVGSPVGVGAYDNFTAPKAPWNFCFSDTYQVNHWRVAVRTEFERLVKVYKSVNRVSTYEFQNANNDVDLQNAQIQQFIKDGCSIIFSIPGSTD